MLDLDLHHLRVLLAVADAGGFTAAADRLATTQPAVSRAVAEVERRLRTPVFVRSTRRVELSAQGRAVLPLIRRLVEDADAGLHHLEGYLTGTRGSVAVAALPSVAALVLPPVVAARRRARPGVDVRVLDGLAETVGALLARGDVDLAVTVGTAQPGPAEPLGSDRFFLLAAPGHRLLDGDGVAWADLTGEELVVFGPDSSLRAPVERALGDAGARPAAVHEAQNVAAVAGLVAAGVGVTAAPGLVLPLMGFAGLGAVPLVPGVERPIRVVRDPRRPLTPAAADFLDALLTTPLPDLPGVSWSRR